MSRVENYLQIQRLHPQSDPDVPSTWRAVNGRSDYPLTEIQQAFADVERQAKAQPGRPFRIVNIVIATVAEVTR